MDIQLTQILFQIVNFSVVLGAVTFLLYKPVLKIFDERARRIAEGEQAAVKAQRAYEEIEKQRKDAETALKKEKTEVLRQAQKEAQERKEAYLLEAREEAKTEISKLQAAWKKEKELLLKNAQKEMAEAIVTISEKVIGTSLDKKASQKLIDTELTAILKNL